MAKKTFSKVKDKAVEEAMATTPPKGVRQYICRADRRGEFEAKGWTFVREIKDRKQVGMAEMVLMEKKEK